MKAQTIAAAVGAALIFGAGWAANGWRLGQDIAQIQLTHTQELAARDAGTFAVAQAIDTKYQGALNASIQEQARLAGAAAVATRNAGRLREQLSEGDRRIATASATAVRDYATTANQLLGHCSQRYTELAAKADGHALDARVCRAAWPANLLNMEKLQ
ncbi:hypothetical protein [Comamonas sp. CMM02]|uniref:hypothetical protein n=1 Tax=Comamonas sp. CMM02 TaxID=2769307 RepID=UPI00177B937D|nr:hypothetical protein [Comamonas sp. CMM02]MBD9402117.1 hypothetical protein [Comamonas sp. CMM02]